MSSHETVITLLATLLAIALIGLFCAPARQGYSPGNIYPGTVGPATVFHHRDQSGVPTP